MIKGLVLANSAALAVALVSLTAGAVAPLVKPANLPPLAVVSAAAVVDTVSFTVIANVLLMFSKIG
ncbi:hypothetical protein D3C85_914990 [compost metagenome]